MTPLLRIWTTAAMDLGLEIKAPYVIAVAPNTVLIAEFLLKNFGGPKGILIFTDIDLVWQHKDELAKLPYGYSVLQVPNDDDVYEREEFIEMLSDWTWTGDSAMRPKWIIHT